MSQPAHFHRRELTLIPYAAFRYRGPPRSVPPLRASHANKSWNRLVVGFERQVVRFRSNAAGADLVGRPDDDKRQYFCGMTR